MYYYENGLYFQFFIMKSYIVFFASGALIKVFVSQTHFKSKKSVEEMVPPWN